MSLTDPTIRRREKKQRSESSRTLTAIILWLPLTIGADLLVAISLFGVIAGGARYMALYDISEMGIDGEPWQVIAAAIGFPAAILLGLVFIARIAGAIGALPAVLVRIGIFWAVAAIALPTISRAWMTLDRPLTALDGVDNAWLTLADWLPWVYAGFALANIVAAVIVRQRAAAIPLAALTAVQGTITAVEQLGVRRESVSLEALESINRITVSFVDEQGTTRWAEKVGFFTPADVPAEGTRVQVHYDPRKPSNVKRMTFDLPWSRKVGR
jgi:hypothetical protein